MMIRGHFGDLEREFTEAMVKSKDLTDRAVYGDSEALSELDRYRPHHVNANKEQRSAALAAGLRPDT